MPVRPPAHAVVSAAPLRCAPPQTPAASCVHTSAKQRRAGGAPPSPCGQLPRAGPWAQDWALSEASSWGETMLDFSFKKKGAGSRKQPLPEPLSFAAGLTPGAGHTRPHFPPLIHCVQAQPGQPAPGHRPAISAGKPTLLPNSQETEVSSPSAPRPSTHLWELSSLTLKLPFP